MAREADPSALAIGPGDPSAPDVADLLARSEALAHSLYPAESVHMLPVDALLEPEALFLVARIADGEALGCGALKREADGSAEIKRMFVREDARGRGIGAAVLARLEAEARARGVTVLRLETGVRQPEAISLYRAFGFRERGPFGGYGPDPLSVFMEKALEMAPPRGGPSSPHPASADRADVGRADSGRAPAAGPNNGDEGTMDDRFDYEANLARATRYRAWRSPLWPPAREHRLVALDLGACAPALPPAAWDVLDRLRVLVEADWERCKREGVPSRTRFHDPAPIAAAMRDFAAFLAREEDRRAVLLRADAVEHGYRDEALSELAGIEDVALVAGQIATWYGKQTGGLPTAFACRTDAARQAAVVDAAGRLDEMRAYLRALHAHLRIAEPPAFLVTDVFYMAGEGARHPKHIAYFLPEDEGVKRSPFKKTYYLSNTHRALVDALSRPLAERHLEIGRAPFASADELGLVPTLGVFAHEVGHFVHREGASFAALNAEDRWASVVLQEISADVFGILFVADVLAPATGSDPMAAIHYHLAECLRYVDRGLGFFPDSDGMLLQLNYLVRLGALALVDDGGGSVRLVGDVEAAYAGLRSLARVLADTLLAQDVPRTLALHRDFGPAARETLNPLLAALAGRPRTSIEYASEPPETSPESGTRADPGIAA